MKKSLKLFVSMSAILAIAAIGCGQKGAKAPLDMNTSSMVNGLAGALPNLAGPDSGIGAQGAAQSWGKKKIESKPIEVLIIQSGKIEAKPSAPVVSGPQQAPIGSEVEAYSGVSLSSEKIEAQGVTRFELIRGKSKSTIDISDERLRGPTPAGDEHFYNVVKIAFNGAFERSVKRTLKSGHERTIQVPRAKHLEATKLYESLVRDTLICIEDGEVFQGDVACKGINSKSLAADLKKIASHNKKSVKELKIPGKLVARKDSGAIESTGQDIFSVIGIFSVECSKKGDACLVRLPTH